jgi:Flp pilus assembly protein TadG
MIRRSIVPGVSCHFHRCRTGATTVELALVLPVFLLIVFTVVEIGRGFMTNHLLTNAARTGCRVGILPGKGVSDIAAAVDKAMANQGIRSYRTMVKINGIAAENSTVILSNDEIAVSVAAGFDKISWLPWSRYLHGDIVGQFTLVRE